MRWPTRVAAAAMLAAAVAGAQEPAPGRVHWIADGRPTAQARQLVTALRDAADRGLRPEDYDAAALARAVAALDGAPAAAARADSIDRALARAATRLALHLHAGRVDPRTLGLHLPDAHAALDTAALVRTLARADDVARALDALEPPYAGYRALRQAHARYRTLAAQPDTRPPAPSHTLRTGDPWVQAPALRRHLARLGDLAPTLAADTSATYDSVLAVAVTVFQRRHGLAPDGVLGPATAAALRVPLAERAGQLALALERWRWLPDTMPARLVVVNVPAFQVLALERDGTAPGASPRPAVRMNVIVGEAEGGRSTPVFTAVMREVVFRPYWDVPPSIARGELLPRIRRDPGYLARERLEIVHGGDHDAVRHAPTAANLRRVATGALRLRQRPGPWNALGPVKFVFPNPYNVYLHGTPAPALFAETRRDFSHGCIRVEEPATLAAWVLRDQAPWTPESIRAAMADDAPPSRRVRLARPISVFVLYATAVAEEDGTVRFLPDLYGHDAALARRLRQ